MTLSLDANNTLKLRKRSFIILTMKYLDHAVRPKRFKIALPTTACNEIMKALYSFAELKSFLGLSNVFSRSAQKIVLNASPRNHILKKG